MKKAFLNWSSGKDAAYALYLIQKQEEYAIRKLITTLNSENDRVSMHGLRKELLEKQVESIGIPLQLIEFEGTLAMEKYNELMGKEMLKLRSEAFTHSIYGDIFLEDLKEFREKQLQKVGLTAVFPLWKKDTGKLMADFIAAGFKAITISINLKVLDASFCGRIIDSNFMAELPPEVDPAGENGEFHSFVFDGPIFSEPVTFETGDFVRKSYSSTGDKKDDCFSEEQKGWDTEFLFCDLLPK
jgi:uncharacterized protein (TIGR00290 family)